MVTPVTGGEKMINFILGIVIGAAFAPAWIKLWNVIASTRPVKSIIDKIKSFFKEFF